MSLTGAMKVFTGWFSFFSFLFVCFPAGGWLALFYNCTALFNSTVLHDACYK